MTPIKTLSIVTLFISFEDQVRKKKNSCRLNVFIYFCTLCRKNVYSL